MTKKINEEAVLNELRQGSAFFRDAAAAPPPVKKKSATPVPAGKKSAGKRAGSKKRSAKPDERLDDRTVERTNDRTDERSKVPSHQRMIKRHAFDVFADQFQALQQLQLEAVRAGKRKPTLGGMVQRALDLYLQKAREEQGDKKRDNESERSNG
ncbi:MAG: hypothetical protein ACK2UK_06270 [Candidatus Promineifilaceae bacterium]|jgi:hypothetical protein